MLADCSSAFVQILEIGCPDIWVHDICRGQDKPHMPATILPTLPTLQEHEGDGSATCPGGEVISGKHLGWLSVPKREAARTE